MAKTQPIGVRFREDIIETLKEQATSPQKVLNFLENFYSQYADKIKEFEGKNQKPELPPINDFEVKYTEIVSILREIKGTMTEKAPFELSTLGKINWEKSKAIKIADLQNKLLQIN